MTPAPVAASQQELQYILDQLWGRADATGSGGGGAGVIVGFGPPSAAQGADGDYYLDSTADRVYGPKDSAALDAPRFATSDSDVPTATMSAAYRLGMDYRFLVAGQITGARYRRNADTDAVSKTLTLFDAAGALVATSVPTVESAGVAGWVRASFPTAIPLNAGDEFTVVFVAPAIGSTGYTAPPGPTMRNPAHATYLRARYDSVGTTGRPASVQADVNRFVDIEFRPAGGSIWPLALAGVPPGGIAGQSLVKTSAADQDVGWGAGGGGGAAGSSYVHNQATPAATWTISHGLGYFPNVAPVDSLGREFICDVTYVDTNTITLTLTAAVAGKAYVS